MFNWQLLLNMTSIAFLIFNTLSKIIIFSDLSHLNLFVTLSTQLKKSNLRAMLIFLLLIVIHIQLFNKYSQFLISHKFTLLFSPSITNATTQTMVIKLVRIFPQLVPWFPTLFFHNSISTL